MTVPFSRAPRRSFFRSVLGLASLPFVTNVKATEAARYTSDGQPIPISGLISRLKVGDRWFTAIYRKWAPGDEAKCRLCDRCYAVDGGCLITTPRLIPKEEAKLYSSLGRITPGSPNAPDSN